MRPVSLLVIVLFLACGSGCGLVVHKRQVVFNEAEYAAYAKPGTAVISGQAFVKTAGGDVKYGAGDEVHLSPVTAYSTEGWNFVVAGERTTPADPRSSKYCRMVRADGQGRFQFTGLPAGEYYVGCEIQWEVATGAYTSIPTGGVVGQRIKVSEGEHVDVILPRVR